jgi:hypothetical protein
MLTDKMITIKNERTDLEFGRQYFEFKDYSKVENKDTVFLIEALYYINDIIPKKL